MNSPKRFFLLGAVCLTAALMASSASAQLRPGTLQPIDEPKPSVSSGDQRFANAAFNGDHFLVVWAHKNRGANPALEDIYATRIGLDGIILDPLSIVISDNFSRQTNPRVASDGDGFMVVWDDGRDFNDTRGDIYAARVDGDGEVVDPDGILVSNSEDVEFAPLITFDGDQYLVVWRHQPVGAFDEYRLRARRLSTGGETLDESPLAVSQTAGVLGVDTVFDGTNHTIIYTLPAPQDGGDLRIARVSPAGQVLDPDGQTLLELPGRQMIGDVVRIEDRLMVLWSDNNNDEFGNDILGAFFDANGDMSPLGVLTLASGEDSQLSPSGSFDGERVWVAWTSSNNGPARLRGRFVSEDGTLDAIRAVSETPERQQGSFSIFAGEAHRLFWGDGRFSGGGNDNLTFSATVSDDGEVGPENGELVGTLPNAQNSARSAVGSDGMLVVWIDDISRLDTDQAAVFAQRVSLDGQRLGEPVQISAPGAERIFGAQVFFDGARFVAHWSSSEGRRMRHISSEGLLEGDPIPLPEALGASSSGPVRVLSVLGQYLWVWDADFFIEADNASHFYIRAMRTTPQGEPIDAEPVDLIDSLDRVEFAATVGMSGARAQVAWGIFRGFQTHWALQTAPLDLSDGLELGRISTVETQNRDARVATLSSLGGGALLSWYDTDPVQTGVYGVRINRDGGLATRSGSLLQAVSTRQTAVGSLGLDALITWSAESDGGTEVKAARIDAEGNNRDPGGVSLGTVEGSVGDLRLTRGQGRTALATFVTQGRGTARTISRGRMVPVFTDEDLDNTPPIANPQTATTDEDTAVDLVLTGMDDDGDEISFEIVSAPLKGILSGTPPNLTYTPNADLNGEDSFTVIAVDSRFASSMPATVSITINPINDPPVFIGPESLPDATEGELVTFTLQADDVDGDGVTFTGQNIPDAAIFEGETGVFTWQTEVGDASDYALSFNLTDGDADVLAMVSLTILPQDDPEPDPQPTPEPTPEPDADPQPDPDPAVQVGTKARDDCACTALPAKPSGGVGWLFLIGAFVVFLRRR